MMSQASLDERLRTAAGKVPGVSLLVVGPEGVRARAAVGFADLEARTPMATDLGVPWFSMTKIATARQRSAWQSEEPLSWIRQSFRWSRPCAPCDLLAGQSASPLATCFNTAEDLRIRSRLGGSIQPTILRLTPIRSSMSCLPSTPSCGSSQALGRATPTSGCSSSVPRWLA